ncbi:hypothetical protein ADK74_22000 [Streptomyces decoyicus]|nr:hypothetical protein ADK74_22000 [Streptomyces decoyicus]
MPLIMRSMAHPSNLHLLARAHQSRVGFADGHAESPPQHQLDSPFFEWAQFDWAQFDWAQARFPAPMGWG